MHHVFCRFVAAPLLCYSVAAAAELGGHSSAITSEQLRIKATLRRQDIADPARPASINYSVYELTSEIGTRIREYADASGIVFAVTWQGPAKPNLDMLLGRHFQAFIAAPSQPGTGPKYLKRPDLVVFSGGHPRAFVGRAYLPALIPAGVDINALP